MKNLLILALLFSSFGFGQNVATLNKDKGKVKAYPLGSSPENNAKKKKTTTTVSPPISTECWWDVSNTSNITEATCCVNQNGLKVRYINPYPYKIKIAFYLYDVDGKTYGNRPYITYAKPGQQKYHNQPKPNGKYNVLVKKYTDSECKFPDTN